MRSTFLVFGLVGLVALPGCGGADRPSLVTVTGQVTLNGQPLSGATLSFLKDPVDPTYRRPTRAVTDASGNFTPNTYADSQGIAPGKYKVAVSKQEIPEEFNAENPEGTAVDLVWVTPKFYSDFETSGLTVEITSSGVTPAVLALESTGEAEVENTQMTQPSNIP